MTFASALKALERTSALESMLPDSMPADADIEAMESRLTALPEMVSTATVHHI